MARVCGRDWLQRIKLDWSLIGKVEAQSTLDTLLDQHKDLFKDELGTIHPFQASIHLQPDAKPKFCKPRSVPFAVKSAELDQLEESGALVKVTHSDWAAPIVPVRWQVQNLWRLQSHNQPSTGSGSVPAPKTRGVVCHVSRGKEVHKT